MINQNKRVNEFCIYNGCTNISTKTERKSDWFEYIGMDEMDQFIFSFYFYSNILSDVPFKNINYLSLIKFWYIFLCKKIIKFDSHTQKTR